jgi:predicted Ser/Thr protein kinase
MSKLPDAGSGAEETVVMPEGMGHSTGGSSSANLAAQEDGRFLPGGLVGGRYRILNLLGKGGMGEVYRATDLTLGQSVALKFLPASAAANPNLLERFHGEVRVARQVSHPNVCRVYDIGEAEGMPYISMEYVDGDDLGVLLQRIGRLPAEKAMEITRKLCAGLAAAHARGVIHRDLKPQNIMLNRRGEVLIMDFGLAAIADQLSGAEARNGTPAYMSPEQLKGIEVTAKSDIYSLGLIIYELFTGKKPFAAASVAELILAQEATTLAGMTTLASDVDPAVEKVVRACLNPEAAKRPASALSVAAALPGGDPLAAALAAGETPSPEMVAAAGKGEGLKLGWALLSLVAVVICAFTSPIVKQQLRAMNHAPLEFSPEVLEQKARDMAHDFGYPALPRDRVLSIGRRGSVVSYLNRLPGPKKWEEWLAMESPLMAWYRESPDWLVPGPQGLGMSEDNPPPLKPGMVEITLDAGGRLRSFRGVPQISPAKLPVTEEAVFRAAQLDRSSFEEIPSTALPLGSFDALHKYKGKHPGLPGTELTAEIATYKGQLTYFEVAGPWETPVAASVPTSRSTFVIVRDLLGIVAIAVGLVFAPLLARRNWKLGRADRKGAFRIAVARFVFGMLYWAAMVHAVPSWEMVDLLLTAISLQLLQAGIVWVVYLALEPALRSKWPHAIVSWNRLLAGKWDDSMVASHILIGCAAGSCLWVFFAVRDLWSISNSGLFSGGPGPMLYGVRSMMGGIFARLTECLSLGLVGFFFLFGARMLLRRDWLAALAGALFFPLIESSVLNSTDRLPIYLMYALVYAVLLLIMLRLGVVALMSTMLFLNIIGGSALGTDLKTWYAPNGIAAIAILLIVAGWSFYRSLGERDLLGGETSEPFGG